MQAVDAIELGVAHVYCGQYHNPKCVWEVNTYHMWFSIGKALFIDQLSINTKSMFPIKSVCALPSLLTVGLSSGRIFL